MTRTERISKLTRAIKEYRGAYVPNSEPKKWIRYPKPSAKVRVLRWLKELGVKDTDAAFVAIDAFANYDAMHAWLSHLQLPPGTHTSVRDEKCEFCDPAGYLPHHPHCPNSAESKKARGA